MMSEREEFFLGLLSRRTFIKGLIGLTFTLGGIGCAGASSPPAPSKQLDLNTTLLTYRGNRGSVYAVVWHDMRIASGGSDGVVQVWEATTGRTLVTYRGHTGQVTAISWSPGGQEIVSSGTENTAQVWKASTGSKVLTYTGHHQFIYDVAWSPDRERIASASFDGTVQVWEAATGKTLWTYRQNTRMWTAEWSPNGKYLASAGGGVVQVWETAHWRPVFTYPANKDSLLLTLATRWSSDSGRIAAVDNDTARVWDAITGNHVLIYHGHTGQVIDVAWSPDGKHVASSGADQTVQVWDASTGMRLFLYHGHTDAVYQLAWSPDGRYLASGSDDETVRICQVRY